MRLLFLTMGYPSNIDKSRFVFLQRLVNEMADCGHQCTVIAPRKMIREKKPQSTKAKQRTPEGNTVDVYYPRYLYAYLTSRKNNDLMVNFSTKNYIASVIKTIEQNNLQFDYVYAHFVGTAATCAVYVGKKYGVPAFAAAGESELLCLHNYDREKTIKTLNELTGIISVSTKNKCQLIENGVLSDNKIKVFPNGIRIDDFYPRDRMKCREKFGFDKEAFIVSFVGHFIERKGPKRVADALEGLPVLAIYAGKGKEEPIANNTIFAAPVDPSLMPEFLGSSDIFVLPTLNEGCCNAIIEALAMGLPVVSSDLQFNDDILDATCSIKIDPNSISDIREAVFQLYQNREHRAELAEGAKIRGESLSIRRRAEGIVSWMEKISQKGE